MRAVRMPTGQETAGDRRSVGGRSGSLINIHIRLGRPWNTHHHDKNRDHAAAYRNSSWRETGAAIPTGKRELPSDNHWICFQLIIAGTTRRQFCSRDSVLSKGRLGPQRSTGIDCTRYGLKGMGPLPAGLRMSEVRVRPGKARPKSAPIKRAIARIELALEGARIVWVERCISLSPRTNRGDNLPTAKRRSCVKSAPWRT